MMSLPTEETAAPPLDADLVARTIAGDGEALGLLYERYAGMLARLATRLLGSRSDGEDVVQDLFVALPEWLVGYREGGRLAGWLRRSAVNLALKRMRTVRRRREEGMSDEVPVASRHSGAGDGQHIRQAVDRLPDDLRAVVILKVVEGYSHAEVAALLGISRGASEVRLSRAMDRLRKDFGEER